MINDCILFSSGGTLLKQEEQPMWCMKTFLMPRMLVTTCQDSMSATVTWWFFTTTQTEYVQALLCVCVSGQVKGPALPYC